MLQPKHNETFVCLLLLALGFVLGYPTANAQRRSTRQRSNGETSEETSSSRESSENTPTPSTATPSTGTGKKVVVERFSGPQASQIRAQVVRAIEKKGGYEIVSDKDVRDKAKELNVQLNSDEGYVAVAKALQIAAFVDGTVSRAGRRGWRASVRVRNGADGKRIGDAGWSASNIAGLSSVGRSFWEKLGEAMERAQAPDQQPAVQRTAGGSPWWEREAELARQRQMEEERERREEASAQDSLIALEARAGLSFFTRDFSYNDPLTALRPYSYVLAPALTVQADWYPATHFKKGWLTYIGLTGSFEYALGLSSEAEGTSNEYPTSSYGFSLGLRGRYPIRRSEVTFTLAYGKHAFSISDKNDTNPKPAIPSVSYGFLRIGPGGRISVTDRIFVTLNAAYLIVLSSGEISSNEYFPRLSAGGIEFALGGRYRILPMLEAFLNIEMRRYFFTMNPEPGDMQVAGGAIDQYFVFTLGAAYRFTPPPRTSGQSESGSGSSNDEPIEGRTLLE